MKTLNQNFLQNFLLSLALWTSLFQAVPSETLRTDNEFRITVQSMATDDRNRAIARLECETPEGVLRLSIFPTDKKNPFTVFQLGENIELDPRWSKDIILSNCRYNMYFERKNCNAPYVHRFEYKLQLGSESTLEDLAKEMSAMFNDTHNVLAQANARITSIQSSEPLYKIAEAFKEEYPKVVWWGFTA